MEAVTEHLHTLLGQEPLPGDVGRLDKPDLPAVFTMSRIDKIKNLSGLLEIFGKHAKLRRSANLAGRFTAYGHQLSSIATRVV